MKVRKIFTALALVCVGAAVLGGCRSEEQGRITKYQPGVYKGKPDQQLSQDTARSLRERAILQSDTSGISGGGTRDVRKPGVDTDALRQRGQNQKGS